MGNSLSDNFRNWEGGFCPIPDKYFGTLWMSKIVDINNENIEYSHYYISNTLTPVMVKMIEEKYENNELISRSTYFDTDIFNTIKAMDNVHNIIKNFNFAPHNGKIMLEQNNNYGNIDRHIPHMNMILIRNETF